MRRTTVTLTTGSLAAALLAAGAGAAGAAAPGETGTGPFQFTPLEASYTCTTPGGNGDQPFVLPAGYAQTVVASEEDPDFQDLPDMNTLNETGPQAGRYLYRAHEVGSNGSVSVTDLRTGETDVVVQREDFERLDGIVWTPWQTIVTAEEVNSAKFLDPEVPQAQAGLAYEVDPVTGEATPLPAFGSRSHEGLRFDRQGNLYGISEANPGYIYKYTPDTKGDLSSGNLYALKLTEGDKERDTFEWVLLTPDEASRAAVQVKSDPLATAAGATAFSRPEDVEISTSTGNSQGGQVMYVAVTGEDAVYAMNLQTMEFATFVQDGVTPGTGSAEDGVQEFNAPDNLALDKAGNLYVTEDPGGSFAKGKTTGDDIWMAAPTAGDALLATEAGRFASLTDCDAEPTGIYFDRSGQTLYVNAMHRGGDGTDYAMAITRER